MDKYDEIYQHNKDFFRDLIDAGVLNMKNGSLTLHYNSAGQIVKMESRTVQKVRIVSRFD